MAFDVNFVIVKAADGQSSAERYEAMTKQDRVFYAVGGDLYFKDKKMTNAADLSTAVANIAQNAADIVAINTTLTKLENTESVTGSIRNIIKGYFDAYTAANLQYKAAEGTEGQEGYKPAVSVKDALDTLNAAIGEGGGVSDQIDAKINALDATVNQVAGSDGLALQVTEVDGKITEISGSIAANTYDSYGAAADVQSAITGTNADTASNLTLYGLSAKAAAAQSAADDAQSDVDALKALIGTGYGTKEVGGETVNKTVKEYIDEAKADATYDDTALSARVTANEDAIELLNKTDGTVGSVKKTVDDAIAAVVASAPSDLDTLKEISDWISGHASDASAMNSQIQANKNAIGVASSPESTEGAGDAVAATGLHKKIEDETARATTAEVGLDSRITTLENKAGADSVADQIDAAIGGLDTASDVGVASVSNGVVTIAGSVKEVDGVIAKGTATDVTLAKVATTGAAADVTLADSGNNYSGATSKKLEDVLAYVAERLTWQEF